MEFDLQPLTEPGKRMVQLAERHAEDFATRVSQHDRDGTFAVENVEAMKKSGFSAGPMPVVFISTMASSYFQITLVGSSYKWIPSRSFLKPKTNDGNPADQSARYGGYIDRCDSPGTDYWFSAPARKDRNAVSSL